MAGPLRGRSGRPSGKGKGEVGTWLTKAAVEGHGQATANGGEVQRGGTTQGPYGHELLEGGHDKLRVVFCVCDRRVRDHEEWA